MGVVEEREQAQRVDALSFVVVGIVLAVGQGSFYLTSAALPLVLHHAGAAQDRIGFEVGLGSLAAFAATLVLGPAINRRGPELFLRTGTVAYGIAALGMLLVPHELSITAFRVLQGCGIAVMGPSAFVLGSQLISGRPGTAIGILGSLNSVALAIGPPVGLALYSAYGSSWLFLPSAAAAGAALLGTFLLPPDPRERSAARGFGFDAGWLPLMASNFLVVMNFGGILAYLPLVLNRLHGPNAGIFFSADAVGVLLLRIPTGIVVDRYGSMVPRLLGIALTIPGLAVLAMKPSILVLVVAGILTGTGAALFVTGVLADLANRSSELNRGTAMSMATASFNASIFVGSAISGLLIGPGGWNSILLFGVITTLGGLPFVLMELREPRPSRAPRSI